jgi:hypothetical protein
MVLYIGMIFFVAPSNQIASNFESFEISQVLCSMDGTLVSNGTVSYLAQLFGLSEKTSSDEISWFRFAYIQIVASEPKRQRRTKLHNRRQNELFRTPGSN